MKRKAESSKSKSSKKGKAAVVSSLTEAEVRDSFRSGLFDEAVLKNYNEEYKKSEPYHHAVIQPLISDELLLSVKKEVLENLAFTPKETDIYRIHQSGDLANISGLPKHLAAKLPSVRRLRDALYSQQFRDYVCGVTGCGALSGTKTDMAINVYTPGCHLLTHDDVIGSRRVSYILYLCGSPTEPWKPEWGGALRLYPTEIAKDGTTKVPKSEWSKVIPPAWNQLSFFEVVPGESFHDVEEVYDGPEERTRMAISGWFHIPQKGEEGYIEGLEEELAKKSSLQSLQSKADAFDRPLQKPVEYPEEKVEEKKEGEDEDMEEESPFTEAELEHLLQFIAPTYLSPDTVGEMASHFAENSTLKLTDFLRAPFAAAVKSYITSIPAVDPTDPTAASSDPTKACKWPIAVPPHKQKYQYLEPAASEEIEGKDSPISKLLNELLPSVAFKKWLQLVSSDLTITSHTTLARRFRRGLDYTLATALPSGMRLEFNLCLTPPKEEEEKKSKKSKKPKVPSKKFDDSTRNTGGYEMYMAPDDDEDGDAAVYKASKQDEEDEDDGVLWTGLVEWNKAEIVLRDTGVLRFVKYVSRGAEGDRWDLCGEYEVDADEGSDDEGSGSEEGEGSGEEGEEEEEEEEDEE